MRDMQLRFPLRSKLIPVALSLGFLGCLLAQGTRSTEAATSEPPIFTSATGMDFCWATPSFGGSRLANPDHAYVLPLNALVGSACKVDSLRFNGSDSMVTGLVEIGVGDESEVAVEDEVSVEMCRVDIQQHAFGIDRVAIGPKITSKVARNARPNISSPLLE